MYQQFYLLAANILRPTTDRVIAKADHRKTYVFRCIEYTRLQAHLSIHNMHAFSHVLHSLIISHVYTDPTRPHPPPPVLVTLQSVANESGFSVASRDILVGCVRTMAVSQKKVPVTSSVISTHHRTLLVLMQQSSANIFPLLVCVYHLFVHWVHIIIKS